MPPGHWVPLTKSVQPVPTAAVSLSSGRGRGRPTGLLEELEQVALLLAADVIPPTLGELLDRRLDPLEGRIGLGELALGVGLGGVRLGQLAFGGGRLALGVGDLVGCLGRLGLGGGDLAFGSAELAFGFGLGVGGVDGLLPQALDCLADLVDDGCDVDTTTFPGDADAQRGRDLLQPADQRGGEVLGHFELALQSLDLGRVRGRCGGSGDRSARKGGGSGEPSGEEPLQAVDRAVLGLHGLREGFQEVRGEGRVGASLDG